MSKTATRKRVQDQGLIILAGLLVVVLVPGYMIGNTPHEFTFLTFAPFLAIGAVLLMIHTLLLAGLYWALAPLGEKSPGRHFVAFVFFYYCSAGFLFPVARSAPMVAPEAIPTNWINLSLALLLSAALTYAAANTALRKYAVGFTVAFLLVSLLSTLPGLFRFFSGKQAGGEAATASEAITALSPSDNIIVLSFDGLPGAVANRVIRETPALQASLADFLVFDNAVATSPSTYASLAGELYGNADFKAVAQTQADLERVLDRNTLLMNSPDYEAYTYGFYEQFNLDSSTHVALGDLAAESSTAGKISDVFDFFDYIFVRVGTRYLVRALEPIRNRIGPAMVDLLDPQGRDLPELDERLRNHQGAKWDRMAPRTIHDFFGFVKNIRRGAAARSVRYLHFVFSHFPVDFDDTCTYRSDDKAWHDANQNETGVAGETLCILKELENFLDRLKTLDIYDQSLIVLKSDHGAPAYFYAEPPGSYRINGNRTYGYDRYRPMLLIKPRHRRAERPRIISELVLLDDLAYTLCRASTMQDDCGQFRGVDLLGENIGSNEIFYIYVPRNAKSSYRYDTHKSVRLSRDNDLVTAMKESGEIDLSAPPALGIP